MMRIKPVFIILTIILCLSLAVYASYNLIISATISDRVDFDHIESSGGINLRNIDLKNGIYYLPIECSAIGKFINKEPKVINPAPLAYYKAIVKQKKHEITFCLKMKVDKNFYKTELKEIKLGKLKTGSYRIYYLNGDNSKVFLKEVLIKGKITPEDVANISPIKDSVSGQNFIPEACVMNNYTDITDIITVIEFETIKNFILKKGDRKTYRNMENDNPHYKFGEFHVYLNPDYFRKTSDFSEIVIQDFNSDLNYYKIKFARKGDKLRLGLTEDRIYLDNYHGKDINNTKEKLLKNYLPIIRREIAAKHLKPSS